MSFIKTILLSFVASVGLYATLCYTLGTPGQPVITLTVTPSALERHGIDERLRFVEGPGGLGAPWMETEPLPPLLELEREETIYSLPGELTPAAFLTCIEFEMLPTVDRTVFVLDALDGSSLDRFNPCVRDHAAEAGNLVVTQCRGGDSLDKAFGRAIGYFQLECDPAVPQFDLEPATPHREFLGDLF
jgi:hypothetical protein